MKKIMKKILFILFFLNATVPCVIRANFPLSFETSVTCFTGGFIASPLCKCVKKILNNPKLYVNFMHRGVALTCYCLQSTASALAILNKFNDIVGFLIGDYRFMFGSNGQVIYVPNRRPY